MAGDDVEMKPRFPKWNVKTEFSGGDTDEQTNSRACKKFVDDVKYETKSAKWGGIWKSIDKRVTEAVYDTSKFDAAEKDTAGEIANNMMQALDGAARTLVENALSTKQIVEDCPAGIIRILNGKYANGDDLGRQMLVTEYQDLSCEMARAKYPDRIKTWADYVVFKEELYHVKLGGEISQQEMQIASVFKDSPSWMQPYIATVYAAPAGEKEKAFETAKDNIRQNEKLAAPDGENTTKAVANVNAVAAAPAAGAQQQQMTAAQKNFCKQYVDNRLAEANFVNAGGGGAGYGKGGGKGGKGGGKGGATGQVRKQTPKNHQPQGGQQGNKPRDACNFCWMTFPWGNQANHWAQQCPWKESKGGPGKVAAYAVFNRGLNCPPGKGKGKSG
jgi:hypothetical protein